MNGNELELWIASLTICNFIITNIRNINCAILTPSIKRTLKKGPEGVRLIEVSLYFECYATIPMFADNRSYFELGLPSCDQFTIKCNPRFLFL